MHHVSDSAVFGATVSQRLDISECPGLARVRLSRRYDSMQRVSDSAVFGATVSQRPDISECPGLARVRREEDTTFVNKTRLARTQNRR